MDGGCLSFQPIGTLWPFIEDAVLGVRSPNGKIGKMKTVSWFSAGVSSAVATKLAINHVDEIIYVHIDDHHGDTHRFVEDCQEWFGKPVQQMQHWYKSVENACLMAGGAGYINGPAGAACSIRLKRRLRQQWEQKQTEALRYVWGFDTSEKERRRANGVVEAMPDQEHRFPLIEQKMTKAEAHKIIKASGIRRPAMYDLGYQNNNCIGCVKGGMAYWNKIRRDFPEVFAARAAMERKIGASCINGVFLDELDPDAGRDQPPIVADCGMFCEMMKL